MHFRRVKKNDGAEGPSMRGPKAHVSCLVGDSICVVFLGALLEAFIRASFSWGLLLVAINRYSSLFVCVCVCSGGAKSDASANYSGRHCCKISFGLQGAPRRPYVP